MPKKPMEPRHTFSIYRVRALDDCIADLNTKGYKELALKANFGRFRLFVQDPPHRRSPKWLNVLAEAASEPGDLRNLVNVSASFVLLVFTAANTYAICGGSGAFVVNRYTHEEFGLEIAARVLPPNRMRNVRSRLLAGQTEQEELLYRGYFNYEIDPSSWEKLTKELIAELTREDLQQALGLQFEGARPIRLHAKESSFSVRRALSLPELQALAQTFDAALRKEPQFSIVKGYQEVSAKEEKQALTEKFVADLNRQYQEFKRSPDEFTESSIGLSHSDPKQLLLCNKYEVHIGNTILEIPDLDLWTLFGVINSKHRKNILPGYLSSIRIVGRDDDGNLRFDNALRAMLYAEIDADTGHKYAFIDAKWYLVTNEFSNKLDAEVARIESYSKTALRGWVLPCWVREDGKLIPEPKYITQVCSQQGMGLLHGQLVNIRGSDKNEVCDILDSRDKGRKKLLFVKRGFGGPMRQVVAQATTSAEFLSRYGLFKERSVQKIKDECGVELNEGDFVSFDLVLVVLDFSTRRQDTSLAEKLTTAVKLDLVKAFDFAKRLGYQGLYVYEVPHCEKSN